MLLLCSYSNWMERHNFRKMSKFIISLFLPVCVCLCILCKHVSVILDRFYFILIQNKKFHYFNEKYNFQSGYEAGKINIYNLKNQKKRIKRKNENGKNKYIWKHMTLTSISCFSNKADLRFAVSFSLSLPLQPFFVVWVSHWTI